LIGLLGCSPDLTVTDFSSLVGCYRTGTGDLIIQIAPDGQTRDAAGRRIGTAFLRTKAHTSQIEFQPGLAIAPDRRRLVPSAREPNLHLLMPTANSVIIGLIPDGEDQPPEILQQSPRPCT